MDSNRFDAFARSLSHKRDRRAVVKSFGAVAFGAIGAIAMRRETGAAPAAKVGICHQTGSTSNPYEYITVSSNAIDAHLAHGDVLTDLTDTANCGACGNVCSEPEHASAYCGEAGCDFTCDTDYEPDGNGGCVLAVTGCASAVLTGPNGGLFCVDDGLHIYVNGSLALEHTGTTRCFFDPIPLGALEDGDEIHVVANNSPETCGDISIDPLYLMCQDTGVVQTLDAVGYPGGTQAGCGVVFYDETFTVDLA